MRLFLTPDQKSGFAIKADGDIVSFFSDGGGKAHALLELAVQEGGTKLDAFETALPQIYMISGFKEVGRTPWDDRYAPEGWDKSLFSNFNNGEPAVIEMTYDSAYDPFAEETQDVRFSRRSEAQPRRPEQA